MIDPGVSITVGGEQFFVVQPWKCSGCQTMMCELEQDHPAYGMAIPPTFETTENGTKIQLCNLCYQMRNASDTGYFRKVERDEQTRLSEGRRKLGLDGSNYI